MGNFLAQNWLSIAAFVASAATFAVHHLGHVNHRVAIDDINDYLQTVHSELGQQNIKIPPPPAAPVKEG